MSNRLDTELVERGLARSREKAKALIKDGAVYINNIQASKSSITVCDDDAIEVRAEAEKYVSRGGYKLEKAIDAFSLDLNGKTCIDIGASTGGFTDCMLKNGAAYVYAIDVGHDQLDARLADDERVFNIEGVNFRYLTAEDFNLIAGGDCSAYTDVPPDAAHELYSNSANELGIKSKDFYADKVNIDFISCDVSFISLRHILPPAFEILSQTGEMVCLIKPQFEAGREHINKKGVVKDKKIHIKVLREIIDFTAAAGFNIKNITYSPIMGPEGNIEYLMHLEKSTNTVTVNPANTVADAFDYFD